MNSSKINSCCIIPLERESKYIQPVTYKYKINSMEMNWDAVGCHDNVGVVIYNTSRNVLVFVKQFRPAVHMHSIPCPDRSGEVNTTKYPLDVGYTIEFCAGLIDKEKPPNEIAKDEVLEECGYDVPLENFQEINKFYVNTGLLTNVSYFFYVEVNDSMKVLPGGGLREEGEDIEIIEMVPEEAKKLLSQQNHNLELFYGLYWFYSFKYTSLSPV